MVLALTGQGRRLYGTLTAPLPAASVQTPGMLRRLLPQPLRLRLWLLRRSLSAYAFAHRRAQPSRFQRLRFDRELRRRVATPSGGLEQLSRVLVINLASRP